MIGYIWGTGILLQEDIKTVMRMILSQSELMLWQGHWHNLCDEAINYVQRAPADPLAGVTIEQLMGVGPYAKIENQAPLGPDVLKEAMNLARLALGKVRTTPPTPSYMGIKQGREEHFAAFVGQVTDAINRADVLEYMKGALLRQCILENANAATRSILVTMPADATTEQMLECMSRVPVGHQAMLVEAVKEVGLRIQEGQG